MAKITVTDKVALKAATLRSEGMSYRAIGKALKFSEHVAKRAVEQGEALVIEAALAEKQEKARKEYPAELIEQVVEMRHEENSWRTISEELHLGSPGTARRIYRRAESMARNTPLGRLPGKGGRTPWVNVPDAK